MPGFLASFVCRLTDSVGMEDQEIPMSEGHRVWQVLDAGNQPKREDFQRGLSVRRFVI
jgi:hypothetical protein